MKRVFEGEQIKVEVDDFDFLEIKRNTTHFLLRTPFFVVPTQSEYEEGSKCMVVNYYKLLSCRRKGILEFDEFEGLTAQEAKCVKSDVFNVVAPVEYQEFYKNGTKYLALRSRVSEPYEVSMENGTLVKHGMFYKVFGGGCYIFSSARILYKFY